MEKYFFKSILTNTCGIQKNGIDDLFCKANRDTDIENRHKDTKVGGVVWIGRLGLMYKTDK